MTLDTLAFITCTAAGIGALFEGFRHLRRVRQARDLMRRQQAAWRAFSAARKRGDTRGQHDAAMTAREATTALLRREMCR